jgi:LmbE family N-acetylglucosaminyl deacetylase
MEPVREYTLLFDRDWMFSPRVMKPAALKRVVGLRRYVRPMVRAGEVLKALDALPIVAPEVLLGKAPVLVLAPHPDDESLGCGGLIAHCHARGQDVSVLVLTDGSRSHPGSRKYDASRLARLRQEEARAAVAALGLSADQIHFLGLPDGQAPVRGRGLREAAALVAAHARRHTVGTICTTWLHDPHHDHRAAYRVGELAARQIGAHLFSYPIWGWTLPSDTWLPAAPIRGARLDIARHLAAKRCAIDCHRSQTTDLIRDDPDGVRLTPEFLAIFARPFEVFIEA